MIRLLLPLMLVFPALVSAEKKAPLNVLFIAVDDMRVELGCYGQDYVISPNIDALAAKGTLFEHGYCQQAVCNPSRASLLTGLRPDTLGIWDLATHFREQRPDVLTLPQMFLKAGYHTEGIGKIFHNWRQDIEGDPTSWSLPEVMHYNTHSADVAEVREGEVPEDLLGVPRAEMRDVPDEAYFDGRIANLAADAIGELKEDEPFFLAVGFWKPHAPFNAPKKYWDLYDREDILPPVNPENPTDVPEIALHDSREILRGFKDRPNGEPTAEEAQALRHGYLAAISYVDVQIGKVIDALDARGLRDSTAIVFWSDHGFHLGEHDLWAKTSNFELDAHVPVIIDAPGYGAGQRASGVVELLDLYPTLAELCGLSAPANLEGKSLVPMLTDPDARVKEAAWTWHPRPAYPSVGTLPEVMGYSMRTEEFRYTEWRSFPELEEVVATELYDHRENSLESANLAQKEEVSAVVEELGQKMAAMIDREKP